MKEMATFATHFFEEKHIRRILIGGTDDNVAFFRSLLPKDLAKPDHRYFPNEHDSHPCRSACPGHANRQRGGSRPRPENGANHHFTGWQGVPERKSAWKRHLQAVSQSRVQTLVVTEGFRQSAHRCTGCGRLTLHSNPLCKDCGSKIVPVDDGVELAVNAVMRSGGDVEVVPITPDFEKAGNIGVFLRY